MESKWHRVISYDDYAIKSDFHYIFIITLGYALLSLSVPFRYLAISIIEPLVQSNQMYSYGKSFLCSGLRTCKEYQVTLVSFPMWNISS